VEPKKESKPDFKDGMPELLRIGQQVADPNDLDDSRRFVWNKAARQTAKPR
jgi:hypothetical protein